ncbi:hypothetical protein MVEN_01816600 [Mycena venus]|uniref:Uncharacterized protein n=1 Tax=Mycena venus TaxID=2733690 RepID=A0A8H6XIS0_9AGAR|nr:hypothetical protein MVEN_01816600 [Mycena venus]
MESNVQTQCVLNSTALNVNWDDMVTGSAATGVGFYLNLSIVAIYTLIHRKTAGKQVLLAFTWAMTVLGTTQMALRLAASVLGVHLFRRFIQHGMGLDASSTFSLSANRPYNSLILCESATFVINNLVTDSLFLFRCYMIWGSRWKVIVFPGLLVVSTFVAGCVAIASPTVSASQTLQQAPYIMAAITNLVLLFLTAGRIWWIRRGARQIGTTGLEDRYSKVIAMIVESGAIYCIFTILLIVTYPMGFPFAVLQVIAMHLVNIVPTLIIVRVGLGQHTQPTLRNLGGQATADRTNHPAHLQLGQVSKAQSWPVEYDKD